MTASPRRVRIVAPSSPFDQTALARGVGRLRTAGFEVLDPAPPRPGPWPYLNGDDAERAQALADAYASDADIIWAARGGYGLTRILSRLSDDLFSSSHKTYVGFSDNTALFARHFSRGGKAIHGPLATTLAAEPDDAFAHLCALLRGEPPAILTGTTTLCSGSDVTGRLFVGNLCVLTHLIGTPHVPDLTGAILCIEEVGERPYRLDRMWTHLRDAGCLDGVAGIALGHLTGCDDPAKDNAPAIAALDVCAERLAPLGVPVYAGFAFGHEPPNFALPIGGTGTLSGGPSPTLHIESA